ncbi:ABC transporter permease [Spiroplasma endosymbiont of Diplazon laetatorius]|uniref:ABC transporter permease n=1 Tax=Spiroplasma endosymbiont of Diplazon laetatorius TaxID=3066322 RepID=UPI0030CB6325
MKKVSKKNKHFLILKSGFKTSFKNIGNLIVLGFLATIAIFFGMSIFVVQNRVDKAYNDLINQSVQHDFVVNQANQAKISIDENKWIGGEDIDKYSNQDLYSQYLINSISRKGIKNNNGVITGDNYFNWSRTEGRSFVTTKLNKNNLNIKVLTKTSIVDERNEEQKEENITVDKIVLDDPTKDKYFSNDIKLSLRETIIQSNFAKKNNIKRGDIIRFTSDIYGDELLVKNNVKDLSFGGEVSINDKDLGIDSSKYKDQVWFQVIGFGSSADFIYPITETNSSITSTDKNLIAYVAPKVFGLNKVPVKSEENSKMELYIYNSSDSKLNPESENDREVYFSGKFRDQKHNSESYLKVFNKDWIESGNLNVKNVKLFFHIKDTEYKFYFRTATYRQVIWVYWMFSAFLLILLSLIAFFIIVLIMKKQIEETRTKIGTLKSLGYSNLSLLMFFISPSIIISLFGTITSYILELSLQNKLVNIFLSYFNINFIGFKPIVGETILLFIFVFSILTALTLLIAYLVVRESALILLIGNFKKETTKIARGFKYLFRKSNPTIKLHSALLMSSTGKIFATSATLFVSITLISSSVIIPMVVKENNASNFVGLNYNNVIEFNEPISNNPTTFLKTYNPNKKENWSYNQTNKVTDISESTNSKQEYITAYPLKAKEGSSEFVYDTNKIIKDLMNNDISRNFYSYNIPIIDKNPSLYNEIAKNNYSAWKNMSLEYLNKLDEIKIPSRNDKNIPYDAIASIINQWTDYSSLVDQIEVVAIKSIKQNIENNIENVSNISKELQNFYKKYVEALPIKVNDKYLNEKKDELNLDAIKQIDFDDQLFKTSTNNIYEEQNVKTPMKLATKGTNRLFYDVSQDSNQKIVDDFSKNFDLQSKKLFINQQDVSSIDLNSEQWDIEQYRIFNTNIILWYWLNYESKIGTTLIQSVYQKANNASQQSIKKALIEGKNYNITTNIVPFDKEKEEIGTLVNGTYFSNNKLQNIKIYGINNNSKMLNLVDKKGNDLISNLFKNTNANYKEYTPIVINSTISEKLKLKTKDVIDISVLKNELLDKNNKGVPLEEVEMGIKSKYNYSTQTTNDYISEHKKNYFSYSDANRGWNAESSISVAKIKGYEIASNSLDGISKKTEIQNAVDKFEIKKSQVGENKKFVIVGITKNYGNSKAWVSNENANKLLGYDKVKKYFFNNYFLNEWNDSNALKNFYDKDSMPEINESQWKKFIDYYNNYLLVKWNSSLNNDEKFITDADNPYNEYINMFLKLSDDYENPNGFKYSSKYLWKIFENEYPIFNYKYSINLDYQDPLINNSKTQPFGDFGTIGMVGNSTLETDETGTSKINYTQGYGENGLKIVDSLNEKKQLLNQIAAILDIVTWLLTAIALIISLTIIVITTVLIMTENTQFIATMKILGYSDKYIMMQIISIYILPIAIMFIIGFSTSWVLIQRVVVYISSNYSFAIPYKFHGWEPIAVFMILISIYLMTILISYKQFSKIRAVDSLAINN